MIVVDTSAVISLAVNCLCPILELLDNEYAASPHVFDEMITRPSSSKRFALESMRIQRLFKDQVIKTYPVDERRVDEFLMTANRTYKVKNKPLKIIHKAEAEALILGQELDAQALLMDERTLRSLMESPRELAKLLERRNKKKVRIDEKKLKKLIELTPDIPVIRSTEVLAVAYEKGILSGLMDIQDKQVLTAGLSALKLSGCSITWEEIEEYDRYII